MAERTSELTIKDLNEDIVILKDKLKFQQSQTSDLKTDLTQKSSELIAAKSQIKELNSRVSGMTQSILNIQDQQLMITRLEEEKADMNRTIRGLRGEVTLLSEQLEEVILKLDAVKSGQKPEGAFAREIVILKRKNHELIMKLFDERDKNKDIGEKAMRRIKILENNWKKAEAEVYRFDELVENIRETCIRSQAQLTQPAILHIVRLIDGVATQSSLKTSDQTPHKSLT
uniref:Uncharacterized protein n=1 Tax=Arion vulgaris TaxID=1028688 RepID=A0A0B6ZGM3_9EUPU